MIKFVEFRYKESRELIQINDVRKVVTEAINQPGLTRLYFTDGTHTVVTHTYDEVCDMIRGALK